MSTGERAGRRDRTQQTARETAPEARHGEGREGRGVEDVADVANRLHSAAIHMLRYVRRVDTTTGLSAARLSALSVVVFGGPVTIGDLAAAEQVSAPTMTKLVSSLEAAGLVRRTPDARDRRVVRVQATPRAARIMQRGREARVRVLAATLHQLSAADLTTLGRAADILRELEQQRERPAPPRRQAAHVSANRPRGAGVQPS